ncbi:MAG TPA: thioredoxin family protein [Blastocatellia bacterium]|nr:thioredoxin family protein [Blastocatellia bacterium]
MTDRKTRNIVWAAGLLIIGFISISAQTEKLNECNWTDSTRDIYINGEIDRAGQLMFCEKPRRYALISSKLDRTIILDLTEKTVRTAPKEALRYGADRSTATSDATAATEPAGKYTLVDGSTYLLSHGGKSILIRSHPGLTGEVSLDKLFETVPVWRSLMESYEPKSEAVAALKASDKPAAVTVVLGSWCPDSKNYVPKMMKALGAAGNDRLQVKVIGIDNQFHEPIDIIQQRRIINVPTVIVEREGREIGRIVETPAAETMEEDLAAILKGKPNTHTGRWDRGPLLARGTYQYLDQTGKQQGSEEWEMFSTNENGHLIHSTIKTDDLSTEVWHRLDGKHRPTFVEITKQRGDGVVRTRYRFPDKSMTARLRGNQPGVIEQTLSVPEQLAFVSPAVAAEGWGWMQIAATKDQKQITSYFAPRGYAETVGALRSASYEVKGEEAVRVGGRELRAKHLLRKAERESSEWWLHPELMIPVRGKVAGGFEYVLTSLEAPANK